jgi:DNA-binding XRE family transcriptional regulator/quercetin dioxygenase-like cupin family protein
VPTVALQIGGRIRAERARKGISLRGLARSVGLSPSLISQIETGKCQPSVSTLYAITTALGISVQDVFGESRPSGGTAASGPAAAGRAAPGSPGPDPAASGPAVSGRAAPGSPGPDPAASGLAVSGRAASGPAGPAVPAPAKPGPAVDGQAAGRPGQDAVAGQDMVAGPGQREILELDSGVTWERLGHAPGSQVDFLLVSYAPGGCSSPAGHLMQHPGTEYGYLLRGELVVTLGSRSHRLTPGDSVSFTSVTPHSYRNEGTVPAVGVWFVAGPDGA